MKQHRILVVGVGSIGERHVRCFKTTSRAVIGICELNTTLCKQIAQHYAITESFNTLESALAAGWDAAVVATPARAHIPIAIQLAENGVNLLIEKPLSVDLKGIDQLQSLVRDKGLLCSVAYVYRAHPGLAAMHTKVRMGFIGKPLSLIIKCGQCFPFYRPSYRDTYYADRMSGGGAIQDAATHLFNAAEWLIGPIDRVCADAEHQALPGIEVEDAVHILARQGRAMSVITMNQFQPVNELLVEVHGDAGSVQLAMHESCWRWADEPGGAWQTRHWEKVERDDPFIIQANAFLDALESTRPPLCTLEEGTQTLLVNLAVLRSAFESGAWEEVAG